MVQELERKVCLSSFIKEIRDDKKVFVFNSLRPQKSTAVDSIYWEEFRQNLSNNKNAELFHVLSSMNLIISSQYQDDFQLEKAREKAENSIPNLPTTLYLVLTDDCNMKCSYCPFSKKCNTSDSPSYMDENVARNGIDVWLNSLSGDKESLPLGIIFYGGEPLLNYRTFKSSLGYISELKKDEKLPANTRLLLDTNGLLLDSTVAETLKENDVEVTVALDSFSETNDIYRKDDSGEGTFKRVVASLELLKANKIKTYLSMSITPESSKSFGTLLEQMERYGINGVGVNILRGEEISQNYGQESARALVDFFIKNNQDTISEFQTSRRLNAFANNSSFLNCGGFGEHMVIHADGSVGNCPWTSDYILNENVQNITSYADVKEKNFYYTRKDNLPLYNEKCLDCEAISICGGNCIWAFDQSPENANSFCYLSKQMIKSLIVENSNK